MIRPLAAVLIAVMLAATAAAQTETAEQTAIRRALEELAGRRAEVLALKETIGAKDKQIAALSALLDNQAQIITLWKTAATERAAANAIDSRIEQSYKDSITNYALELARVRLERDKANRAKKLWGLGGFILGGIVAAAVVIGAK